MKSTGIVRRLDDLGRVCLPKELRRTLHIEYGDPVEIFVSGQTLVLKKYSEGCSFCGNENRPMVNFYPDKPICQACVKLIVRDADKLQFTPKGNAVHAKS